MKELIEYIPKRKRIYFYILTLLLFLFVVVVIRYSDIPVWPFLPVWVKRLLVKHQGEDMTFYNLGVSYIVSYMFYLLVNFIPDFLTYRDEIVERINLRCAIHREVQLFTFNYINLWKSMVEFAIKNGKLSGNKEYYNKDIFTSEILQSVTESIILCDQSESVDYNLRFLTWFEKLNYEIDHYIKTGNIILDRYNSMLPSNIFYDIFFLINDGILNCPSLKTFRRIDNTTNFSLHTCFDFNSEAGLGIVKSSCNCILDLFSWVNNEYDYLKNRKKVDSIMICPIDSNPVKNKAVTNS